METDAVPSSISADDEDEKKFEPPPVKKVKIETADSSFNSADNSVHDGTTASSIIACSGVQELEALSRRLTDLENKWHNFFGDVDEDNTQNQNQSQSVGSNIKTEVVPLGSKGVEKAALENDESGTVDDEAEGDDETEYLNKRRRPRSFKCPSSNCRESSPVWKKLVRHCKTVHPGMKLYKCNNSECRSTFTTAEDLADHAKGHGTFNCEFCLRKLNLQKSLDMHTSTVHGLNSRKCPQCDEDLVTYKEYVDHLRSHEQTTGKQLLFTCQHCPRPRFHLSLEQFNEHLTKAHNIGIAPMWF